MLIAIRLDSARTGAPTIVACYTVCIMPSGGIRGWARLGASRRAVASSVASVVLCSLAGLVVATTDGPVAPSTPSPQSAAPPGAAPSSALPGVVVTAPEPRYVAPTRRDRIGRIWAPVYIDGKGPFRLVLDSGATASGINARVARELGLTEDNKRFVRLRGVVGLATVPVVQVSNMTVGELTYGSRQLPVVTDPLGGADGILSTYGMGDGRIYIDFHHDQIVISNSRGQAAPPGFLTIPFQLVGGSLIVTDATVGGVSAQAIIDTGGQVSIANSALREALAQRPAQFARLNDQPDTIQDVTLATQSGDRLNSPPILLGTGSPNGTVKISNDRLTFGDMHIFEHWGLTRRPALMIGIDALGLLDVVIIDYRRHELQVRLNE